MNSVGSGEWLVGGGEMGALIRDRRWSETPLGPRKRWPQSLRTAVSLVVESGQAMCVAWGPEWRLLYNDACRTVAGDRHPGALGRPAREAFAEDWVALRPICDAVTRGESAHFENLSVARPGADGGAERLFDVHLAPLRAEDGRVAGALITLDETLGANRAGA